MFIVGRIASAARRSDRRPHPADLASDRRDHSDASAACVGRNAADYAPTFSSSLESEDDCDKNAKKTQKLHNPCISRKLENGLSRESYT